MKLKEPNLPSAYLASCSARPKRHETLQRGLGAATAIAILLTTCITTSNCQAPTAFVNPDFYFDFSNIKSSGTSDFVVDQVTKNPMNAFTFESKSPGIIYIIYRLDLLCRKVMIIFGIFLNILIR